MQKPWLVSNQRLFRNTLTRRERVREGKLSLEELDEQSGMNERLVNMRG